MSYAIRSSEGKLVAIEEDYGTAEEYKAFLNEVSDAFETGEWYTLTEATIADYDELKEMES